VSTKSYPQLDTFVASARAVPSSVKSDIADAAVVMCATDIRPFDIVEGAGFHLSLHIVFRERYTARDGNGQERLAIVRDGTGTVFK